jgi:hypothetical protein
VPSVPACLCRRAPLPLMLMLSTMCCFPAVAESAPAGTNAGSSAAPGGVSSTALSGDNSALSGSGNAALSGLGNYDLRLTFAPLTLPDPVNAYRSSNGTPGPQYWQNEADYELHATLDTANKQLRATEVITYTNNSPDALPSVWLQLDQNIYREDSRAHIIAAGSPRPRRRRDAAVPAANTAPEKTSQMDLSSIQSRSSRASRGRRQTTW